MLTCCLRSDCPCITHTSNAVAWDYPVWPNMTGSLVIQSYSDPAADGLFLWCGYRSPRPPMSSLECVYQEDPDTPSINQPRDMTLPISAPKAVFYILRQNSLYLTLIQNKNLQAPEKPPKLRNHRILRIRICHYLAPLSILTISVSNGAPRAPSSSCQTPLAAR